MTMNAMLDFPNLSIIFKQSEEAAVGKILKGLKKYYIKYQCYNYSSKQAKIQMFC
jgi:hypothetical protein